MWPTCDSLVRSRFHSSDSECMSAMNSDSCSRCARSLIAYGACGNTVLTADSTLPGRIQCT